VTAAAFALAPVKEIWVLPETKSSLEEFSFDTASLPGGTG
jgi:hypothetical protein